MPDSGAVLSATRVRPLSDDLAVARAADVEVLPGRLLVAFFERMEDIDGFVKFCDIKHPMFRSCVNPQLDDAGADVRHRPPSVV